MPQPTVLTAEPQLFVRDIAKASAYYVDRLGFDLAFTHGEPAFYGQVKRGGARLNLRQTDGPIYDAALRDEDILAATIVVDDTEALFRQVEAAGATFHQRLEAQPWGARTFIVADPDGNLIAFAGD